MSKADAAIARAEKAEHERDVLTQKSWEHERELAHARVELEISRRERDEARREIIGFECGAGATNRVRRRVAEERWPGSNLYPENEYPSEECVSASEVTGGSDDHSIRVEMQLRQG